MKYDSSPPEGLKNRGLEKIAPIVSNANSPFTYTAVTNIEPSGAIKKNPKNAVINIIIDHDNLSDLNVYHIFCRNVGLTLVSTVS
jgi:hypothetical protein